MKRVHAIVSAGESPIQFYNYEIANGAEPATTELATTQVPPGDTSPVCRDRIFGRGVLLIVRSDRSCDSPLGFFVLSLFNLNKRNFLHSRERKIVI